MRILQLAYFYYFLFSGTKIKSYPFFIILDMLFLIVIPVVNVITFFLKQKKMLTSDGVISILTLFYFIQIILKKPQNILKELIYYIPILIGYFLFFKKNMLKEKDYRKIIFIILGLLGSVFFLKSTHLIYKNGIFNSSIGVGIFSLLGIYLLSFSNFSEFNKKILLLFFITMIVYSNTRGALVAVTVYFVIGQELNIKKMIKNLLGIILAVCLLEVAGIINFKRILNKYNTKLDILTGRGIIWQKTIWFYKEESILGSGVGHFNLINFLKQNVGIANVHNGYLDLIVSFGGILGGVILIAFFFRFFKLLKLKKSINLGIIISILTLNLSESIIFFTRVPIMVIFWIAYGNLERKHKTLKKYKYMREERIK